MIYGTKLYFAYALHGSDIKRVINDRAQEANGSHLKLMDMFLMDIEKRAYHIALFATKSHADALDLLQDSMIKLVKKYQHKSPSEWKPLFYKILRNRILDWHRHQKVRDLIFFWKTDKLNNEEENLSASYLHDFAENSPEKDLAKVQQQNAALRHLANLSEKQRQCFLLRSWEGMSVTQTADIMGCSQGSVKTHYSRAIAKLRTLMEAEHEISF